MDFFRTPEGNLPGWLTPERQAVYLAQWQQSLTTACHYYSASPLVPPRGEDESIHQLQLPEALLSTPVSTHILWGQQDAALLPALLQGLEPWVPHLSITYAPDASHWLVHERPELVIRHLHQMLHESIPKRELSALESYSQNTDFTLDY